MAIYFIEPNGSKNQPVALAPLVTAILDGAALDLSSGATLWLLVNSVPCAYVGALGWVPVPGNSRSRHPCPQHLLSVTFNEQLKSLPRCLMLAIKGFSCHFSNENVNYFKYTENNIQLSHQSFLTWARCRRVGPRAEGLWVWYSGFMACLGVGLRWGQECHGWDLPASPRIPGATE